MKPCDVKKIWGLTDDAGDIYQFSAAADQPTPNAVLIVDLDRCVPIDVPVPYVLADTDPVITGDLVEIINADNESSLAAGCRLTVTDVSRNRQIIRGTTDTQGLKHPHMLLRSDVRRVPHVAPAG